MLVFKGGPGIYLPKYFPTTFITKTHRRLFWKVVHPAQAIASLHPTWLSPMMSGWLAKQPRTRRPPEETDAMIQFLDLICFEPVLSQKVLGSSKNLPWSRHGCTHHHPPTVIAVLVNRIKTPNSELQKIMTFNYHSKLHKASMVPFPHFPLTEGSLANDFCWSEGFLPSVQWG